MRPRNVIFSLILLLAFLAFIFIKLRFLEPRNKLTFKRNPSRISYSPVSLCRMDCLRITANEITEILKKGEVISSLSNLRALPCPIFAVQGLTTGGRKLGIEVTQCGTVAKITACDNLAEVQICNCPAEQYEGISVIKYRN